MHGTHTLRMGARGRLMLPAELCDRIGLVEGTPLVMVEAPTGLVLLTEDQLRERVREDLAGLELADQLFLERRVEAAREDAG